MCVPSCQLKTCSKKPKAERRARDRYLPVEGARGEFRHSFVGRLTLPILRDYSSLTTEMLLFLYEQALGLCEYPFVKGQRRLQAIANAALVLVRGRNEDKCTIKHREVVAMLFQVGFCTCVREKIVRVCMCLHSVLCVHACVRACLRVLYTRF